MQIKLSLSYFFTLYFVKFTVGELALILPTGKFCKIHQRWISTDFTSW